MMAGWIWWRWEKARTEGKFAYCGILAMQVGRTSAKKLQLDGVKLNQPRALAVADFKGDGSRTS